MMQASPKFSARSLRRERFLDLDIYDEWTGEEHKGEEDSPGLVVGPGMNRPTSYVSATPQLCLVLRRFSR